MENYKNLSFAFKEMLKETKIMGIRLKDLRRTMNKYTSELFIKNEQYGEMQLNCDGISASIGYLNIEIKRTKIMFEKAKKNISINEITTISSVDENNGFVETNKSEEKSTSRGLPFAGKVNQ